MRTCFMQPNPWKRANCMCSANQMCLRICPNAEHLSHRPLCTAQEACDLMVQCMSLDPEQRPTATEVMQRLAALQNHQA